MNGIYIYIITSSFTCLDPEKDNDLCLPPFLVQIPIPPSVAVVLGDEDKRR